MNNYLGQHLIIDLYTCDEGKINDLSYVEETLVQATIEGKMHEIFHQFHKFQEQGVSGVVVVSESHLSIHTWPEYKYAAIDLFACGNQVDLESSLNYILKRFGSTNYVIDKLSRGELDKLK